MSGTLDWQTTDTELVRLVAWGEAAAERELAFKTIYTRHYPAVLRRSRELLRDQHQAEDLTHDAFVTALAELRRARPPTQPERLRAWLCGIAANRANAYRRGVSPAGRRYGLEVLVTEPYLVANMPPDDDPRSAELTRHAHLDRLLAVVVATFTERQRRIYELSISQGLEGANLAGPLGLSPEQASRRAYEIKTLALEGFGALVLARDGRSHCRTLAAILDQAAWNGENFTNNLRNRIIMHFDTCRTCDNCSVCAAQRKRLAGAYAPALIPVLFAAELQQRALEAIRPVSAKTETDKDDDQQSRPSRPSRETGAVQDGGQGFRRPRRRHRVLLALAAVVFILVGTAAALLLLGGGSLPVAGGVSSGTFKMAFHLTAALLSDPLAPASGGPEVAVTIDSVLQPARAVPGTVVHITSHVEINAPYVDFSAGGRTVCLSANQRSNWGTTYHWDNELGAPDTSSGTGVNKGGNDFVSLYPVPPASSNSLPNAAPIRLPARIKIVSHTSHDTGCGTVTTDVTDITITVPRSGRLSHGKFLVSALGQPRITHVESIDKAGHITSRTPGSVGAAASGVLPTLTIRA